MSEIISIDYGRRSAVSRWFDDYWSEQDRRVLPWLFLAILCMCAILGPGAALYLVSVLPINELGNSGASIRSHLVLQALAAILAFSSGAWLVVGMRRPSQIELGDQGMKKVWQILGLFKIKGPMLAWSDIRSIRILRSTDVSDLDVRCLVFESQDNVSTIKLYLRDLEDDYGRQNLVSKMAKHATAASIDPEVFEALAPQRALSFTEIWLDALSAPPKREQLLPLSEGVLLDKRYRVKKRLGLGGQGTVYLAEDTETQTGVVLKETILPVYADLIARKGALEAFHKEAFALESAKHPNIVKFLGSFVADHRAYLVLEFIDGQTLTEVIQKNGPLKPEQARAHGVKMCEVLSVLHGSTPPLVHRDFTPDNLMVAKNGELMLIDFAAAAVGDKDSLEVAGKPAYMAPEQFKGKPVTQSDIYSMGGSLHFVLTGEHPESLSESWPMLANDQVPADLNDVVNKCTKLDAKERYLSVDEVKKALLPTN